MTSDHYDDMPEIGSRVTKYNDRSFVGVVLDNFCAIYTPEKGEPHETKCTAVLWDSLSEESRKRHPGSGLARDFQPFVQIVFTANLVAAAVESPASVISKLKDVLRRVP